jgi:hypothetical protein
MNCPHGWTEFSRAGKSIVCPLCHPPKNSSDRNEALRAAVGSLEHAPDLEAIADLGTTMAALVHELATCKHTGAARVRYLAQSKAVGNYCVNCGARKVLQKGKPAAWRLTALADQAMAIDAARQKLGASWGRPSYDSDVKNVIPIKTRT